MATALFDLTLKTNESCTSANMNYVTERRSFSVTFFTGFKRQAVAINPNFPSKTTWPRYVSIVCWFFAICCCCCCCVTPGNNKSFSVSAWITYELLLYITKWLVTTGWIFNVDNSWLAWRRKRKSDENEGNGRREGVCLFPGRQLTWNGTRVGHSLFKLEKRTSADAMHEIFIQPTPVSIISSSFHHHFIIIRHCIVSLLLENWANSGYPQSFITATQEKNRFQLEVSQSINQSMNRQTIPEKCLFSIKQGGNSAIYKFRTWWIRKEIEEKENNQSAAPVSLHCENEW